ncbi:methyltransferase domain-containing protein [Kitasatospora sp. NPDC002227]|uniref:class I SAM-dependent methyltransferase n=1 Tax=Kitasatospora sp. NPDC002227 TaxID=3154773 RepID=UPI0033314A9C
MPQDEYAISPAVRETYGPADLSREPVFAGGFINFGHWHGIDLAEPLGEAERIRSQENLYRRVLDAAELPKEARVLEVGCGLGMGCALTLREYDPAAVTGVDIHPEQLRRARERHTESAQLRFTQGAAEQLPFDKSEFDAVISVEAAQHFPDLAAFATEAARVLRPGGRVAVTSFFAADDTPERPAQLAELLPTFADGLDLARPATALAEAFAAAGLEGVGTVSIGDQVWPGWDTWLGRLWAPDTWPRNFRKAWQRGILDYYLVTARQPDPS